MPRIIKASLLVWLCLQIFSTNFIDTVNEVATEMDKTRNVGSPPRISTELINGTVKSIPAAIESAAATRMPTIVQIARPMAAESMDFQIIGLVFINITTLSSSKHETIRKAICTVDGAKAKGNGTVAVPYGKGEASGLENSCKLFLKKAN